MEGGMIMSESASDASLSRNEASEDSHPETSNVVSVHAELYDGVDSSKADVNDDYSKELVDNNDTKKDTELYDETPSKTDKTESKENLEKPDNSERTEEENQDGQTEVNRSEIYENSEYSNEVNDKMSSKEELEVYQNAELKEATINDRTCLIREIDMDYVDSKTGLTNRQLMEKGRSPYDSETGERIELHHIGQDFESPFAEVTADSEHGRFYSVLHTKETESWRNDVQKSNHYNNVDRPQHWKARAKESEK